MRVENNSFVLQIIQKVTKTYVYLNFFYELKALKHIQNLVIGGQQMNIIEQINHKESVKIPFDFPPFITSLFIWVLYTDPLEY